MQRLFAEMSLNEEKTKAASVLPLYALPFTGPIICSLCGFAGAIGWIFYGIGLQGLPAQDWMVFYIAGRAYLEGNLPLIFDGSAFTASLNERFAAWLAAPLQLQPWLYPPIFLLLFLPFALLSAAVSFAVFQATGFAAACVAVWRHAVPQHCRQLLIGSLVLCPAVPFNVIYGQNAFYTSALLIGGFGLIGRHPMLAGALFGLLTYKPQFWLMVPVALVAARQWRALASALVVATLIALASLLIFGADIWRVWLDLATGGYQYQEWAMTGRRNGISVFACAILLGAPARMANLAQSAAILGSALFVHRAFRQPCMGPLSLCVLLAATLLAAPHASAADAILTGMAAALFFASATAGRLRSLQAVLAAAVWLSPFLNPPSVFLAGVINPVLLLLFLLCVLAAMGDRATIGVATLALAPQRATQV